MAELRRGMELVGFELSAGVKVVGGVALEQSKRTTVVLSRDLVRRAKSSLAASEYDWKKTSMTEAIGRALELAIAWDWKMPELPACASGDESVSPDEENG